MLSRAFKAEPCTRPARPHPIHRDIRDRVCHLQVLLVSFGADKKYTAGLPEDNENSHRTSSSPNRSLRIFKTRTVGSNDGGEVSIFIRGSRNRINVCAAFQVLKREPVCDQPAAVV
jgi:hypothetical protein